MICKSPGNRGPGSVGRDIDAGGLAADIDCAEEDGVLRVADIDEAGRPGAGVGVGQGLAVRRRSHNLGNGTGDIKANERSERVDRAILGRDTAQRQGAKADARGRGGHEGE
jgi:hypothetical protein